MALPITIPNTFAGATGPIPLSQLDNNFLTVVNGINGIGNGTNSLANVSITGGSISNVSMSSVDVSFLQSGTGAVTRTVQSKERDVVSVKDFGAVGNGIANDTAAIQAAITYALSTTYGGNVRFPIGSYLVSSEIQIPKTPGKVINIIFDYGAVVTNAVSYTGFLFYVGSSSVPGGGSGVTFSGLSVVGNTGCKGLRLENANITRFINCRFSLMDLSVQMASSYAVTFEGCLFESIQSYCIYSTTSAHHTLITNTNFYSTGIAGTYTILFAGSTDNLIIRDSDAETGWCFLGMTGGSSLTFEGNYVEYFTNTPLYSSATIYGVSIANNWIALSGNLTLGNIEGGQYKNNASYTQTVSVNAATVNNLEWSGNTLLGGGGSLQYSGRAFIGASQVTPNSGSQIVLTMQGLAASSGTVVQQHIDHNGVLRWQQVYATSDLSFYNAGNLKFNWTSAGIFQPGTDATGGLGATGARWGQLYTSLPAAYGGTTHIIGSRSGNGESVKLAIAGEYASNAAAATAGVAVGTIYFDTGIGFCRART
jgi:hypothetical protein